jgi:hypothetical protein
MSRAAAAATGPGGGRVGSCRVCRQTGNLETRVELEGGMSCHESRRNATAGWMQSARAVGTIQASAEHTIVDGTTTAVMPKSSRETFDRSLLQRSTPRLHQRQ